MEPQNCPWCGKKATITDSGVYYWARCTGCVCGASGPMRESKEEALTAWNRVRLDEEKEEQPKPCPGCLDEEPSVFFVGVEIKVNCVECGMMGPNGDTRLEAVQLWNTLPRR